jgi:hypothetical protein
MRMKSIYLLLILAVLASACKKSEENKIPPTIKLIHEAGYIAGDTMLASGDEIKVKVQLLKGDLNITNFLINVYTDSVSTYFDTGMNTENLMWEGDFLKTLAPTENWKFMAIDREGNATTVGFTITLDTNAQYGDLITYSPIDFGAQDNPNTGGCFDIADSTMYGHLEVAADPNLQTGIDMICFYEADDKHTIASPGANFPDGIFPVNPADWTHVNTSRYHKTSLTRDDFNNAVNDSIILANYDEGEAKRKAKKLKAEDVYTFKTHDGRLGIFVVNAVEATSEGSVNISLKTQQ